MAEAKTKPTASDVSGFLDSVEPAAKRADGKVLADLFGRATGEAPRMWGPTIVGYGSYHYRYDSGHEGRAARVGFSPRKAKHSLYLLGCGDESSDAIFGPLLARLGKYGRGASCLYVNKLADIDLAVLEEMVAESWKSSFKKWPES